MTAPIRPSAPPRTISPTAATRWLADRAALADAARAHADAAPAPDALVAALLSDELYAETIRVLAYALPKRQAVWWAWVAARHATHQAAAGSPAPNGASAAAPPDGPSPATASAAPSATPPTPVQRALDAVEKWIAKPDEGNRRAAQAAADVAGLDTPAGCTALATGFTGGSVAPPDSPVVPPPPGVFPKLIAAAVLLAATAGDPRHTSAVFAAFVAQATEIVKRLGGWEPAVAAAQRAHETELRAADAAPRAESATSGQLETSMGKPASRVGDMHVCPMVTPGVPPIPHVGGPILPPGSPTVLIGGVPAAVATGMCTCVGPPDVIALGSVTVLIGKMPAARMGDLTGHGGTIVLGFPTVLIGG